MHWFRLIPRTALHLGRRGVGLEGTEIFCGADTLFSAFCLTVRHLQGDDALAALLERFPHQGGLNPLPPFRFTSAFPCAGDVRFLPKPLTPAHLSREAVEQYGKRLKEVRFVSLPLFTAWLNGDPLDAHLAAENFLQGGSLWVTAAERNSLETFRNPRTGEIELWRVDGVPRVTVDRVTSRSAVYQAGAVRYRRVRSGVGEVTAGLWLLVEWLQEPNPAEVEQFRRLLIALGENGLGGERSAGYGWLDVKGPHDFPGFPIQEPGKRWLTLSPYHPRPDEVGPGGVVGEGATYALLLRRGWVTSPEGMVLQRPAVRMLGEGSVLHHPEGRARPGYGDLADVTPGALTAHRVWRYGIAFPVPISASLDRLAERPIPG